MPVLVKKAFINDNSESVLVKNKCLNVSSQNQGEHRLESLKLCCPYCCRPLTWIEERGPGLPRTKNINFQFDSYTLTQIPPAPKGSMGLFMQDLNYFSAKLAGQVSPEDLQREKVRILHCLKVAETIQEHCQV